MASYQEITGLIRSAITAALAPTGITVLPYPGDTQALPTPCWCVGVPTHAPSDRTVPETMCRDPWGMTWPITLYEVQSTDRTSTDLIDDQCGLLIEALRADETLGGLLDQSEVVDIRAVLGRDREPRLHEVTATFFTVIDQART